MESDTMQNTFRNVRQAQQDEDGLLTDVVSIFEQMKVLNHSRGAGLEALAQKYEEEIEKLKEDHKREIERIDERHAEELEKKDREHREEMKASRARHERPGLSRLTKHGIVHLNNELRLAHMQQIYAIRRYQTWLERLEESLHTTIDLASALLFR